MSPRDPGFAALIFLFTLGLAGPSSAAPRQKLYVTNSGGDDIHVIDVATNRVIQRIEAGPEPHGIATTAAQDVIFVSIENMKGPAGELLWIDPVTDTITKRVPIGPRPNQLACTPDGKIVYVPCDDGTWWVVDGVKGDVLTKVRTGGRPHNTLCAADGRRMYLAPMGDPHQVTICDVATHAVLGGIPFSDVVRPVAMTRDEKRLYAEVDGLVGFEVADIPSRKTIRRVEAEVPAESRAVASRSHGLGLSPDEKELWTCDVNRGRTYVFDATADPPRQIATIAMDGPVYWLCFSPEGKTCYVSERGTDQVAAIDTASKKIVAQVRVGRVPKRVLAVTASP